MRPIPKEVQQVLTEAGGVNLYREPRFRLVWGADRLTKIGGEWIDYNENGTYLRTVAELRDFPKYHPYNEFFYVEKYCPPQMYGSPENWESQTYETADGQRLPACGPYPERGDYELSWRVAITVCPKHMNTADCLPVCENYRYFEAIEPTMTIMEQYVARVLRSEIASDYERLKAIEREQEKERKEKERIQRDIVSDVSPFITGSYVTVPRVSMIDEWRKAKARTN